MMRSWIVLLVIVCIGCSAAAAPGPRDVPPERFVDLAPGAYRSNGMSIDVRKTRGMLPNYIVIVRSPGKGPLRIVIDDHGVETIPPTLGVGMLDRNGPAVIFVQSFSGGAHCCVSLRFISATQSGFQLAESLQWDGDFFERWPKDLDGDGRADVVRNDNAFLYAFACYACSYSPPVVLNVIGNKVEDVSTKPGFRRLFAADMRDARSECVKSGGRGACAAYVADAARIGRFAEAWSEMLRHYERQSDWGYPDGCDDKCERGQLRFRNYPEALLHFLKKTGYVAASAWAPLDAR